jgi:hypothetical protein
VCAHRVYSVPLVDPGFDPQAFAAPPTPEARETAEMYRRALELYDPVLASKPEETEVDASSEAKAGLTRAEIALLDQNEAALRLAVEASRRPSCSWSGGRTAGRHPVINPELESLGRLLVTSARRLQSEGDLDAAFERYIAALRFSAHLHERTALSTYANLIEQQLYEHLSSWAAHADQTPERIRAAIDQLQAVQQNNVIAPSNIIKWEHLQLKRILDGQLGAGEYLDIDPDSEYRFILVLHCLPWEAGRTRRVLNLFTDRDLAYCNEVESAVRAGRPVTFPGSPDSSPAWCAYQRTTPWIQLFYRFSQAPSLARNFVTIETNRRAVRLQMALAGWKAEHGELPERLKQLVGPFLKQLPTDPFTQQPFEYFPKGLPQPEVHESRDVEQPDVWYSEVVSPGKPLFRTPPCPGRFFDRRYSSRHESSVFEIPVDD